MTISSRTPEGQPGRCPICNERVVIEPSLLFGDATCPRCGTLLWFLSIASDVRLYDFEQTAQLRQRVIDKVAEQLGVAREQVTGDFQSISDVDLDSMALVELILEIEEGFER